jgi:hypothetical protein
MATELERLDRIETLLQLETLNAEFCYFLDHNMIDRLLDLFSEHAFYSHGPRVSLGKQKIRDVFENRSADGHRTARHVQSGLRIELTGEKTAKGESICMTFAADGSVPIQSTEVYLVADFSDEYCLEEGGNWRISRREIKRIFVHPSNAGPVSYSGGSSDGYERS